MARPGYSGALEAIIRSTGSPLPLAVFRPKQFSWGVRANFMGSATRFPGMFMYGGTFRHKHNVIAEHEAGPHVFDRPTDEKYPIVKQYGPSVPENIVKGAARDAFESTVAEVLPKRVAHEIGRLLPG